MASDNDFLGQGWGFPPTFYQNGAEIEMVAGEKDIQQSLQILLSTHIRERIFQLSYGCPLCDFVFEELTTGLLNRLEEAIRNAILYYESRIKVENIIINKSPQQSGLLLINIDYVIRTINSRNNIVYPFYLNEATLIS